VLQNTSRWVAFALAIFALVAFGADARSEITSAHQTAAATPPSPGEDSFAGVALDRPSLASRALIRAEIARSETAAPAVSDSAATTSAEPEPASEPEPEPVAAPVVQAAPVRVVPVAPPAAVPTTCPANQFCYPRVGIAGTIVPYNDCSGSTDVGSAIRSISCVSPTYLAAHAYTQFGRIAGWRAGDVVFAYGTRYVVFDAFTQQGCVPPARAIAPLSLQTSLTSATCGPILVVQARPG
jgi:hypothetical protein